MRNLLNNFGGSKNIRVAGLDIGGSSIKLVEMQGTSLEDATLSHYAIEQIPRELAAVDGEFPKPDEIAALIKKCWKKSGTSAKNVTIALPQNAIISKKAIIPIIDSEEDLKFQVQQEINKYLPPGLNEEGISIDYFNFGVNEQNPTDNDMLLIAAKQDKVDEHVALIDSAGLIPEILDIEQYALQNALRYTIGDSFNEKSYLLADCSSSVLRISVFRKGDIVYNKEAQIGGLNLTQDIMNNLDVSLEEAEKMKIKGPPREIADMYDMILKTFLNNYSSEFLRAYQYFVTTAADPTIEKIYLTGGVASTPGLVDVLYKDLKENDMDGYIAKPIIARPITDKNKTGKINLSKFTNDESALFLATGLAIRHLLRKY